MEENKKLQELKAYLNKFNQYKKNLSDDKLWEFYNLKEEFSKFLGDNEKIRFNQIEFYETIPDYTSEPDDLPF